jgi:hypothetical protein
MMSGDEFYDDEVTSGLNENLIQAEVLNRTATQKEKDEAKSAWDALPEWRKEAIREEIEMDLW